MVPVDKTIVQNCADHMKIQDDGQEAEVFNNHIVNACIMTSKHARVLFILRRGTLKWTVRCSDLECTPFGLPQPKTFTPHRYISVKKLT